MVRPTLIFLMILLLLGVSAAADGPICHHCGGEITGDFVEVGSNTYHPFHLICARCGEFITTEFYVYKDEPYHAACLASLETAPHCALCGQVIFDEMDTDFWGNTYHHSHAREIGRCPYCSRYFSESNSKGEYEYPDGRHICGICLSSAVFEPLQVDSLKAVVTRHLGDVGIVIDSEGIPVILTSRDQLREMQGADSTVAGYTNWERLRGPGGTRSQLQIYVLAGLPRMSFINVLAHELTHAWLFSMERAELDSALVEGSCNYASYLVLETYPDEEARYERLVMDENEQVFYGLGFRRARQLAQDRGTAGWLEWIRTEAEFPPGY